MHSMESKTSTHINSLHDPPLSSLNTLPNTHKKLQTTAKLRQSLSMLQYTKTAKEIPEDPETQLALGLLWQSVLMLSQAVGLPNMSNLHRGLVASNCREIAYFVIYRLWKNVATGKGLEAYIRRVRNKRPHWMQGSCTWDVYLDIVQGRV